MAKKKKKKNVVVLIIAIVLIGCCLYFVFNRTLSMKLHCSGDFTEQDVFGEESFDYVIGNGKIKELTMYEYYDLAQMIENGENADDLNEYGEQLKKDEKKACLKYKNCTAEVTYEKDEYVNIKITLGSEDLDIKDIKKMKTKQIYEKLKKESEKEGYTCK